MDTELGISESTLERLPPQSLDAEQAVLGSLLVSADGMSRVVDLLEPDYFYRKAHQVIFAATLDLFDKNEPIDIITVSQFLKDGNQLEQIGGRQYITDLALSVATTANLEYYAKVVQEKALLRHLIRAGTEIVTSCYEETDAEIAIDKAEHLIFSLAQRRNMQQLEHIKNIVQTSFEKIEKRYENRDQLSGVPTGFYDLDAMTAGFQPQDLVIVAARPSMGKCLSFDSEIVQADGSISTIEDIYKASTAKLLTLDADMKLRWVAPSAFVDDGIKPVFKVTTRLGRTVETTLSHPFLTIGGWKKLEDIRVGSKIAVPRRIPVAGTAKMRECEVKLLAYLIGDGCLSNGKVSFTNTNPAIQQDFQQSVSDFGGTDSAIMDWAKRLGLWGNTEESKIIPSVIFTLTSAQVALFLNRLFTTDGLAAVKVSGQVHLGYRSVNEKLCHQIQHLLLRFGILSKFHKRPIKHQDTVPIAFQLDITDKSSIATFISKIGIFGEETALRRVRSTIESKCNQTNRDLIPLEIWSENRLAKGNESWSSLAGRCDIKNYSNLQVAPSRPRLLRLATALEGNRFSELATSDIYWDEVTSIRPMGLKQVYDLTIPDTHNFVANDVCVHNTAFVLNIAQHVAVEHNTPVAVFSLEMSKEQLVSRMLCSEANIDANRLRTGHMHTNDWTHLAVAMGRLGEAPIYIDDSALVSVLDIRAKCRRLKAEQKGLGLVIIDYIQLMQGRKATDNRVQEVSEISRGLKTLAREIGVPVIALSQLSRAVEARQNKRPMLSDLRESGCLTGDSLVFLPESGRYERIDSLVGKKDFTALAVNTSNWKLEPRTVTNAFSTGCKQIFRITTRSNRQIKATANHKFLTIDGWKRLDQLRGGEHLATPRSLPSQQQQTMSDSELGLLGLLIGDGCTLSKHAIQYTTADSDLAALAADLAVEMFPNEIMPRIKSERTWIQVYLSSIGHLTHKKRNPVASWLDELRVFDLRSFEKQIPDKVFSQPQAAIAQFLRHLWATDGTIHINKRRRIPTLFYATSSLELARGVRSLLLRFEINAQIRQVPQVGKGRDMYNVDISGKPDVDRFMNAIGILGQRKQKMAETVVAHLSSINANTNRDVVPKMAWRSMVEPARIESGLSTRHMQAAIGTAYCGTTLYKTNIGRERADRVARIVKSDALSKLANSEVYWDEIVTIEPAGFEEVYDLTVEGLHNFVVNDMIAHNSIEQDADIVMFIYRDEYYNPESDRRGEAEIIIAKQRNGPVGTAELLYQSSITRFLNKAQNQYTTA